MKTINAIIIAGVMICSGLSSCSKQVSEPTGRGGGNGSQGSIQSVAGSDWFIASWQQQGEINVFTRDVPQLTADILKDGKVLVFGKGGFEETNPTPLPCSLDANYIAKSIEVGDLRLVLQGSGAISTSLQFRCILVPANKLASTLNYEDYDAVCNYYNIAK